LASFEVLATCHCSVIQFKLTTLRLHQTVFITISFTKLLSIKSLDDVAINCDIRKLTSRTCSETLEHF